MRKIIFHAHGYLLQKPWACLFIKIIVFCEGSVFNVMSPLAPSERGLPRERVEEPARQETVRLF